MNHNRDDWYNTGLKIGDKVKLTWPEYWGEDYAHEHKKQTFKIVHIQDGRFAVMEWIDPNTFSSILIGHDMRDITKVK